MTRDDWESASAVADAYIDEAAALLRSATASAWSIPDTRGIARARHVADVAYALARAAALLRAAAELEMVGPAASA
jgi:isopropylmalate/homocitrate/citramalate synthase